MVKKILFVIFIALLVLGNIYFYSKTEKLDYAITIGKPVGKYSKTTGVDGVVFYEPVTDKGEANLLIFSFMKGVSIDKPKKCENLPDLTVVFNDWEKNIAYYQVNLWVDGDNVVIANDGPGPEYKMINNGRAVELKKIIERYGTMVYK